MKTKILVVPTAALMAALAAGGLTGCKGSGSHAASEQSAKAKISAEKSSAAGQLTDADAKKLLVDCPIPQGAAQLSKSHWETTLHCAGVPKSEWKAAAGCVLKNVENGHLPKDKQGRETSLVNDAFPCVEQYHGASK